MPHVRIVNASGIGLGTQIEIDGVVLDRVRAIDVHMGLDGPVTVTLEVLPTSLEIDTLADVKIAPSSHSHPADTSIEPEGYGLV